MNARQKVAAVAAAATLVALAGLGTLGRQVTQRAVPFRGCEEQLEHFPADVLGEHARRLPDGLIEYLLENCETVTSHGADPAAAEAPESSTTDTATLQSKGAPVCATTDKYVAIYLQPSNGADNYATRAPAMRDTLKQADGKLVLESQNRVNASAQSHYRVKCNTDGSIYVAKVKSSQSTTSATFSNLISDLQSKGFNSSSEKYWIVWDGAWSSSASGQGTIQNSSSDSGTNPNNNGPSYGFNYGNTSWSTAMHEMAHNLGAVQHDAPGSTTGWHCRGNKTDDVECYNDGSTDWSSTPLCGADTITNSNSYDICQNQYWAPGHRSDSSYIGTHWNQAECYVRWLVATWCGWVPPGGTPTPTPTPTATSTANPLAVYNTTYDAPACLTVQAVCDSGPSLLNGRDTMTGGNEPNQPNSLYSSCPDDTYGTYHSDESVDSVRVATTDGAPMAAGKTVTVTVKGWVYETVSDRLDLFYTDDATANPPAWTPITTLTPVATGAQTFTATYTLPAGSRQAVRASLRYLGAPGACNSSDYGYTDPDDLVISVGPGTTPTPTPTPTATVTATPTPTATPGAAQCADGIDNNGNGLIDAQDKGCLEDPDFNQTYIYDPNDNDESTHLGQWANDTTPAGFGTCQSTGPFQRSLHNPYATGICHVQ